MRVEVDGGELWYEIDDGGHPGDDPDRPTLVLLHGSPGNSDHSAFKPAFAGMADAARIVYLDLRGCGRSDLPSEGAFSLEGWADDLVGFCSALGIRRPIVLGNSAGGMVAATYAIRHPEHPGGLVLSSTQARLDPQRCLEVFQRLGGREARDAAAGMLVGPGGRDADQRYAEVCLPLYNRTPRPGGRTGIFRKEAFVAFHRPGGIWFTMDFLADLPAIRCPTLVLAGSDDPVTPIADSEDIAAALDPAIVRFERFDGAGHGVWLDDEERAFAVLRDFIAAC